MILLAWSGGGRRRSEVLGLRIGDVRPLDTDTLLNALGTTKTDTVGGRPEKPLRGPAAQATEGPLFRRKYKGGKVGTGGLSSDQVARIVQRRAQLAGLEGDWAAHTLLSGFVTEDDRQAGSLLNNRATELLSGKETSDTE
jgi:integrase